MKFKNASVDKLNKDQVSNDDDEDDFMDDHSPGKNNDLDSLSDGSGISS